VDDAGRAARSAVLAVAADGNIEKVEDLRGKTVAFGPRDDARTHHAGLALLREHGLEKSDLSLSLLPIPGSLKHLANMRDIAQSVINGSSDAGFIDEAAFETLMQGAEVEEEPARDKLRVIARTMPVPEKLVIRSPKVDQATVDKVTDFLLTAGEKHPEALHALLFSAYRKPTEGMLVSYEQLAKRRVSGPVEPAADAPK
jgi:ABC-type phosphate/phosphonate transport system substrate-binding protein